MAQCRKHIFPHLRLLPVVLFVEGGDNEGVFGGISVNRQELDTSPSAEYVSEDDFDLLFSVRQPFGNKLRIRQTEQEGAVGNGHLFGRVDTEKVSKFRIFEGELLKAS